MKNRQEEEQAHRYQETRGWPHISLFKKLPWHSDNFELGTNCLYRQNSSVVAYACVTHTLIKKKSLCKLNQIF